MEFSARTPSLLVVDDFYTDPMAVRDFALQQSYEPDLRYYKGTRTKPFLFPWVREEFSRLLGTPVTSWIEQPMNGVFQQTRDVDPLVFHADSQSYAGAVYLTPPQCPGTSFWRHKGGGRHRGIHAVYEPDFTDASRWDLLDEVSGIFNRLVLWDASLFHSAASYGKEPRLVQLFFFDA